MIRALDRLADAGGLLYVVLAGVGYGALVAPSLPDMNASPAAMRAHLLAHPVGASFWTGVALESAGLFLLLAFAFRVATRIRRFGTDSWLPPAIGGLAVASFTIKVASFATALTAVHAARYGTDSIGALFGVNDVSDTLANAVDATVVLLIGTAAWSFRGALPRWIAGSAVAAGAALLTGVAVPALFDTLQLLLLLWLVTTSSWLLLRGERRPKVSPSTSDATTLASAATH
ncbi:MAG: hypothetical protein ACXV5Q_01285 [Frankiaceae bacterium]